MTQIYDSSDLPKFRISNTCQFVLDLYEHNSVGRLIIHSKENLASQIAHKIVDETKFFDVKEEFGYMTVKANCIVMTEQEFQNKMQEQFKKGLNHANGFRPNWSMK